MICEIPTKLVTIQDKSSKSLRKVELIGDFSRRMVKHSQTFVTKNILTSIRILEAGEVQMNVNLIDLVKSFLFFEHKIPIRTSIWLRNLDV